MSQDQSSIKKWVVSSFGETVGTIDRKIPSTTKKRLWSSQNNGKSDSFRLHPNAPTAPWVEKHAPKRVSDLAVHKKKVESVFEWLQASVLKPGATFCLLKGPTGSGKSTTVKVSAKHLDIDLKEWTTPMNANTISEDIHGNKTFENYRSDSDLVSEFVIKGSRYPSVFSSHLMKRIIMIEDWPSSFLRDPALWHTILLDYSQRGKCPLVMVTGDDQVFNKLIPDKITQDLQVEVFNFNPLAPTLMKKILTEISAKEASSKFSCTEVIENICESSCGDLRSAINTLQFACLRGFSKGAAVAVKGKVQKTPEKKRQKMASNSKNEMKELAPIGGRDAPDDFFRTIGKTLYAKRTEDGRLKTAPDEIVEKVMDRADMFTGFIQENYLDFLPDIQSASKCAENLRIASLLLSDSFAKPTLINMGLTVVTRGLMSNKKSAIRHNSFKAHRRPKLRDVLSKYSSLKMDAQRVFPFNGTTGQNLLTEILPYMSMISPPGLTIEQANVVRKMPMEGSFFSMPSAPAPLGILNGTNEQNPDFQIEDVDSD